jgi:hypothetical protein
MLNVAEKVCILYVDFISIHPILHDPSFSSFLHSFAFFFFAIYLVDDLLTFMLEEKETLPSGNPSCFKWGVDPSVVQTLLSEKLVRQM